MPKRHTGRDREVIDNLPGHWEEYRCKEKNDRHRKGKVAQQYRTLPSTRLFPPPKDKTARRSCDSDGLTEDNKIVLNIVNEKRITTQVIYVTVVDDVVQTLENLRDRKRQHDRHVGPHIVRGTNPVVERRCASASGREGTAYYR